jgi:hypothetical protein
MSIRMLDDLDEARTSPFDIPAVTMLMIAIRAALPELYEAESVLVQLRINVGRQLIQLQAILSKRGKGHFGQALEMLGIARTTGYAWMDLAKFEDGKVCSDSEQTAASTDTTIADINFGEPVPEGVDHPDDEAEPIAPSAAPIRVTQLRLVLDEDQREHLRKAIERVNKLSPEIVVAFHEKVYQEVLRVAAELEATVNQNSVT